MVGFGLDLFFFIFKYFFWSFIVVTVAVFNSSVFHFAGLVDKVIFHWQGIILGPEGSPYAGGLFLVVLHFPPDYPSRPPKVKTHVSQCPCLIPYVCRCRHGASLLT